MKKCIITVLICVLCIISYTAYAETLLDFNEASRTLTVRGSIQSEQMKEFVSFAVIPYGMSGEETPADDGTLSNVFYKTAETDADGNFKVEFSLPNSFAGGQYSVVSHSVDKTFFNRFGIADDDFSASLAKVNGAVAAEEIKDMLKSLEGYRIDNQTTENFGGRISEYLFAVRPDRGYSKESFIKQYNLGEGIARFEANEISIGELLIEYSAYTDVDYSQTYAKMTELGKNEMQKHMKKTVSSVKGNFAEVFDSVYSIVEIVGAASPDELAGTYIRSAGDRGRSLSAYQNLSDYKKESVFLKMFAEVIKKNTIAEIDSLFDSLVSEATGKDGMSASGGGGSGSSLANSGSSGAGSYISANNENINISPAQSGFSDVSGHWAEGYIIDLRDREIISGFGDGTFRPDNAVTRAEFTKMICMLFGISGGSAEFSDVTQSDWYYDVICAAYANGLINGNGNGKFEPDEPITREDAAVIIQRQLKLEGTDELTFNDREQIAEYSYEAVSALVGNGILTGYEDNTINPRGMITRAEVAALITRAAQKFDVLE